MFVFSAPDTERHCVLYLLCQKCQKIVVRRRIYPNILKPRTHTPSQAKPQSKERVDEEEDGEEEETGSKGGSIFITSGDQTIMVFGLNQVLSFNVNSNSTGATTPPSPPTLPIWTQHGG